MAQAACPHCFAVVNTSRLAYQCSGRGALNGGCTKDEDPARIQRTGSSALSYPTFMPSPEKRPPIACPRCGGPARRRACPVCHTPMPDSFVDSDSPMLGIVGSKGSGKTVLMTVLAKELRSTIGKRCGAAVRFASDNPDGFGSVIEYTAEREDSMYKGGRLPDGTLSNEQERRRPLVMMWQAESPDLFGISRLRSTTLSFIDSAGEDFNLLDSTYDLQYLAVCDGLMVALDPFGLPGARAGLALPAAATETGAGNAEPLTVVESITEVLRTEHGVNRKKRIKVPLAVVFTKMDAFFPGLPRSNPIMAASGSTNAYNEMDGRDVHEHMRALLRSWDAEEIYIHLDLNYENFRLFGVSALGAEPDYAEARVAPGGVRPHRVEDPVLWLLSNEGAVRRR